MYAVSLSQSWLREKQKTVQLDDSTNKRPKVDKKVDEVAIPTIAARPVPVPAWKSDANFSRPIYQAPPTPMRTKSQVSRSSMSEGPVCQYRTNGEKILKAFGLMGVGLRVGQYEIVHEFKTTGSYGRAFKVRIVDGPDMGEYRVLKFHRDSKRSGENNYLRRLACEFDEYVRLKRGGFADLAIYHDFEPYVNSPEVTAIFELSEEARMNALMTFLKPRITSGYHVVDFVPDAGNTPIDMTEDPDNGMTLRTYRASVPAKDDPDYPFWLKVKENLKFLYDKNIVADYTIHNIGKKGTYFDLRPLPGDEKHLEIKMTLKTYANEGSDLYLWLDPRK